MTGEVISPPVVMHEVTDNMLDDEDCDGTSAFLQKVRSMPRMSTRYIAKKNNKKSASL